MEAIDHVEIVQFPIMTASINDPQILFLVDGMISFIIDAVKKGNYDFFRKYIDFPIDDEDFIEFFDFCVLCKKRLDIEKMTMNNL
jgi:hypothetical protein